MRKKPPSPIENAIVPNNQEAYFEFKPGSATARKNSSVALRSYTSVQRSEGSLLGFDLSNLQPGTSSRPEFNRDAYNQYRPGERIPTRYDEILEACDKAYQSFGVVRNIIDLMSDFASQGMRISHPKPAVQKFLREWWVKIKGADRSERFLSSLFKFGTVVVRMQTGLVPLKESRRVKRGRGADIDRRELEPSKLGKREIPLKYTFLHPGLVHSAGGALSAFMPRQQLFIKIPLSIRSQLKKAENSNVVKNIPPEIIQAINSPNHQIMLDNDKTFICFFKKDDWQVRPLPIIYPILKHLFMLEKLSLADSSALDGAISNIRIFKLGDLEFKIFPTPAVTARLSNILEANTGGGSIDLIWDAAIELEESKTQVHQFLGKEKYEPHLEAVNMGLGIPTSLNSNTSGTTNNFISLKTLIKRLEYGREKLREFWNEQLKIMRNSMGFKEKAVIEFDMDDFGDENAQKRLMVDLSDRNLVSDELLQYRFGIDPELEKNRISRESKERDRKKLPHKAGPYYTSQPEHELLKIALQKGYVTPEETGLDIEREDEPPFEKQLEIQRQRNSGLQGRPSENNDNGGKSGRPPGSKDKQKRKTKDFSPQIRAALYLWTTEAQSKINNILKPFILDQFNKKNIRSLSSEQTDQWEKIKFGVLSNLSPFEDITNIKVRAALEESFNMEVFSELEEIKKEVQSNIGRDLTFEEIHQLQILIYVNRV